ncbi:MAG: tRNA (guanosine(46)-N7)-methyltransferase TrmB [Blautia sp.]|nr:tRNA (guanosine(46)-N7)-methyltransferase TrmB [Blautia sp.]MCM1199827.1 tRNA (guanosine(46)-N7)-methyltransferase TrmB [Bacteroides fragilis]
MRLRNVAGSREVIARSPFVIQNPKERKNRWKELFGNSHPLQIEIGMGKGRFITDMARLHPEINYIGIEKYSSVLIRGIQKMEKEMLPNLYFIRMDAEEIMEVFGEGEADKIYLNFSDPWPKDRHAKRRLPSREFLNRYRVILSEEGNLEFKTDNQALFMFALDELAPAGWRLERVTYDLHHDESMMEGNVMTEYEERFSSMGNPVYKYIVFPVRNEK